MAIDLNEYFRHTFEDKLLIKMPEREDDHLTPATRLLEKRREMTEVEQALAAQKEEFQMKMESLQQRREELERKEYQLKESLLKFDKFLKENDSKKARALKKKSEEEQICKMKETDIKRLKSDSEEWADQKQRLQEKMERHLVYQKYMERVVETAEEFQEIREILARHDTLITTHQDLMNREQENQDRLEKQKTKKLRYIEEKNNEILNYNNRLATLQTKLDKTQSEAVKWESKWTHIKNTAAKKTLLLGRIKMATHNLYMLVSRHQKQATPHVEDTYEQLTRIQQFIQDLTQITQDIRKEQQVNASTAASSI